MQIKTGLNLCGAVGIAAAITLAGCSGGGNPFGVIPTPTTTPTTTPPVANAFAGQYAGGLRLVNGSTYTLLLNISSNGAVTNVRTNGDVYTGTVSNSGAVRFKLVGADLNAVVTGQLTRSGSAVSGSGRLTATGNSGTLRFRSVTPASRFAGNYTGSFRIIQADGSNKFVNATAVIQSNGLISMFVPTGINAPIDVDNLIGDDGTFVLGNSYRNNNNTLNITTIQGRRGGGPSGNGTSLIGSFNSADGQSGDFTLALQ